MGIVGSSRQRIGNQYLNELGYTIEITPATKALVRLKKDLTVVQSEPEV